MIEIEKPNITTVNLSDDGRNGKFIVEPLVTGLPSETPSAVYCSALCPVWL